MLTLSDIGEVNVFCVVQKETHKFFTSDESKVGYFVFDNLATLLFLFWRGLFQDDDLPEPPVLQSICQQSVFPNNKSILIADIGEAFIMNQASCFHYSLYRVLFYVDFRR